MRSGFETSIHPVEKTTRQLFIDPTFSNWVLLSSLSKFCVSDEVVYLSLREKSLMYRSSDSVTTFGLPDQAFDINYPVSVKSFRVPCTSLLETFSLAKI